MQKSGHDGTRVAAAEPEIDSRTFRNAMGRFPTGVAIVTFLRDGQPSGITVNSFLSVSASPPLILVSLRKESSVIAHLHAGDCYGVNFLSEAQQEISSHFAGKPVETIVPEFLSERGVPLIPESLAHIVARIVDVHIAGDHVLYIAAVEYLWQGPEAKPLIFYSGKYKQIHAHEPTVYFNDALEGW